MRVSRWTHEFASYLFVVYSVRRVPSNLLCSVKRHVTDHVDDEEHEKGDVASVLLPLGFPAVGDSF
jgi:hypothetical protein